MNYESKYSKWYFAIIQKAQSLGRSKKQGYFESHHIIPKCLGGSNKGDNRVLLTAREHFVCHAILVKMASTKFEYEKMVMAFNCMYNTKNSYRKEQYQNSRLASKNRERLSILAKQRKTALGLKRSKKQRAQISARRKNSIWMYDPINDIAKSVNRAEKNHYLEKGYIQGRRPGVSSGPKNGMFGKKGSQNPNFGKKYPGSSKGRKNGMFGKNHSEKTKKEHSLRMQGRFRIKDPKTGTIKFLPKEQAEVYLKCGWLSLKRAA